MPPIVLGVCLHVCVRAWSEARVPLLTVQLAPELRALNVTVVDFRSGSRLVFLSAGLHRVRQPCASPRRGAAPSLHFERGTSATFGDLAVAPALQALAFQRIAAAGTVGKDSLLGVSSAVIEYRPYSSPAPTCTPPPAHPHAGARAQPRRT